MANRLGVLLLGLMGCAASTPAARAPDGSPYTLEVFIDRNAELQNATQVAQVVGFMEPDLRGTLLEAGFNVVPCASPQAFVPGPNRFLLIVKILNYDPGSKAARMIVGLGAGALVLDTQHLLYARPDQLLLNGRGSVGSSRDWTNAARKINLQIAREVNATLAAR